MSAPTVGTDCDVLVVGAGPTGLTLAAQLLARGICTRIIDKDPGTPRLSRAIAIQPRTLETLDTMGIAERFLDEGHRVQAVSVYRNSKRIVGIDMARCGSAYRFQLHLPQHRTEALLRERVGELGGAVQAGVELVGFTDDGAVVTAAVRDRAGVAHEITTSFIVGCDGAHSQVRHLLDAPFTGQAYPWDWLLADTRVDWRGRPDEVHVFVRPDGLPLACVPITEDLWRLSLPMPGDRRGAPPTLEEIQVLVDERGPGGMVVSDPEALTTFRCQIRSTSVYRHGRILLAGDAVHIHSPAGGQGMNTGMLDATNLGWKLALVAAGDAPDALLDTYGQERGPVARQVLGFTQSLVQFGTVSSTLRRARRAAGVPLMRLAPVQKRLAGRMAQTAVAYPDSPLTRRGRPDRRLAPGQRMLDLDVQTEDGPTTLNAALRRGKHVLITPNQAVEEVDVGPRPDLVEFVTAPLARAGAIALVRPDGYLAAAGSTDDMAAVRDYLRQLSGAAESACAPQAQA